MTSVLKHGNPTRHSDLARLAACFKRELKIIPGVYFTNQGVQKEYTGNDSKKDFKTTLHPLIYSSIRAVSLSQWRPISSVSRSLLLMHRSYTITGLEGTPEVTQEVTASLLTEQPLIPAVQRCRRFGS